MITIAGFITDFDKFGRFSIMYPRVRDGKDVLNTELQLNAYADKHPGWSPLRQQSFLAKLDKRSCFAYNAAGDRLKDFSKAISHNAVFEVELLPFVGTDRIGWFIKVYSIALKD